MRPFRIVSLFAAVVTAAAIGCESAPHASEPDPEAPDSTPIATISKTFASAAVAGTNVRIEFAPVREHLATQLGGRLAIAAHFVGSANALRIASDAIDGTPSLAGVVKAAVVATDTVGRVASDTIAVAVFAPGLRAPLLPLVAFPYSFTSAPLPLHFRDVPKFPVGFQRPELDSAAVNVTTDAGATLGRVLFYDSRLSLNDSISCGSCHLQSRGFADSARFSMGIFGRRSTRRAMGLSNVRMGAVGFFWDQRATSLEQLAILPIENLSEMGANISDVVTKLSVTSYYPSLFEKAFGTPQISKARIARALAQYLRSLTSAQSQFDGAFGDTDSPDLTKLPADVRDGHALFAQHCATCHSTVAQIVLDASNNGLLLSAGDTGAGRGRFRVPSLRNVAARPPFMHDGRFSTLDEVVDFYDNKVVDTPDLDLRMRADLATGPPRRLQLSAAQRAALVAFMTSLTDPTFLTADKFSNPFVR